MKGPTESAHVTPRPLSNGREDCWSEGATSALIDSWGDRYLQLNRGNLRQKDWKEVSDAVNARQDGVRHRKTDVQCKNRIDTLKKKYKVEKAKSGPSTWPFYSRLDRLIGSSVKPIPVKPSAFNPTPNSIRAVFSGAVNSFGSSRRGDEEEDGDDVGYGGARNRRRGGGTVRELARAIVRFGEIYERIESAKQEQMMELERQRMEFAKELEFQRMQMFMEAQLELEKMKRPKYSSGTTNAASVSLMAIMFGISDDQSTFLESSRIKLCAWERSVKYFDQEIPGDVAMQTAKHTKPRKWGFAGR